MTTNGRFWPPVAVVALGDPALSDDGLPLRVMGRVRTLIGEIASSRAAARLSGAHAVERTGAPTGASVQRQGSLGLATAPAEGPLVQWIEGGTESDRIEPYLENRERVVLIDTLELGGKPGSVYHWHLEGARPGELALVRHYGLSPKETLFHLPFWLEDDVPPGGFDLIAIEPSNRGDGSSLSAPIRQRFATICSQVTALVFRVLVEEGW